MRRTVPALLLIVYACSSPSASVTQDTGPPDLQALSDAPDELDSGDAGGGDLNAGEDGFDIGWQTDLGPEELVPECEAGQGCFLDQCNENGDCQSGWCVEHMGEQVCTKACSEECPPGWHCQQVADRAPDLVFVCASKFANLCRPCAAAADCAGAAGTEAVCVDYGVEGSFCGGTCATTDDCPWGFTCIGAASTDGVVTKQCVADAGVCPCTETAAELGLWTPCVVENEFGACAGKRICTQGGLSDCSAAVPAEETCNGLDDDCDGDVDEWLIIGANFVGLCDDDNACTDDVCKGEEGCTNTPVEAGECVDGDPCTVGDHCEAGVCVGSPVQCDDSNPCTDDTCDGLGGCHFEPNQAACDDGDPCTVGDFCSDAECGGTAVDCDCFVDDDCAPLEDGDLCNGTLVCDTTKIPHRCVVDVATEVTCPPSSDPDNPCQDMLCSPETGQCSMMPVKDGFACTTGSACTLAEICQDGECQGGVSLNCEDGNPCTADSCSAEQGCLHEPLAGPCDDANACTTGDSCQAGKCKHTGLTDCDDDNVCTTDSCDPDAGCLHALNTAPCDDNDVCTMGDHCALGECISSGILVCNDGNPCTDDSCAPAAGCKFEPNSAPCDDGSACTVDDACAGGSCQGGPALDCNDGNVCTADSCDPAQGCISVALVGPCDDGDACTAGDVCANAACAGSPVDCDDGNGCTTDLCDNELGCVHVNTADPCDDGNACTQEDVCGNGACAGTPVDCDDANVCTDDSCDTQTGCVHVNNSGPCPDGKCVDGNCLEIVCAPATGNLSLGTFAELYGFCWYLSQPGGDCDATCAEVGGSNLALQAEGLWPDNCDKADTDDVSDWFYKNGNPGQWSAIGGGTGGHTLGYGYVNSSYYGKCTTGTSPNIGSYPGSSNDNPNRSVVCPCFKN